MNPLVVVEPGQSVLGRVLPTVADSGFKFRAGWRGEVERAVGGPGEAPPVFVDDVVVGGAEQSEVGQVRGAAV